MASGNYAELKKGKRAAYLALNEYKDDGVEQLHFMTTIATDSVWGRGGVSVEDVEMSSLSISVKTAKALVATADSAGAVDFGNGWTGVVMEIADTYFWAVPLNPNALREQEESALTLLKAKANKPNAAVPEELRKRS